MESGLEDMIRVGRYTSDGKNCGGVSVLSRRALVLSLNWFGRDERCQHRRTSCNSFLAVCWVLVEASVPLEFRRSLEAISTAR